MESVMHTQISITIIFALCGMLMAPRTKTSISKKEPDEPILYDVKVFEHGGFCYFAKAGDKNAYIVFLISSSEFPYEKYEYRVPNGNSANPWNNEASVRLNDQTNTWVKAFCKKANLKFPPPRNATAKPVITDIPKVPDVPKDYSYGDRELEELTDKYVNAIKTAIEKLNVEMLEEAIMKPQEFSRATLKDIAKDGKGVMTRAEFMEEMRPLAADHDQIEVEFLQGPFDSKGKDTKQYFKMVAAYDAARTIFIPKNFTPHEFSISNRAERMRDAFYGIDHVWTENSEGDLYQNLNELRKEIKEKLSKKRNEIKTTKKVSVHKIKIKCGVVVWINRYEGIDTNGRLEFKCLYKIEENF